MSAFARKCRRVLFCERANIRNLLKFLCSSLPLSLQYFRAAWHGCTNNTAVKHLDVDSPALLPGLYEQDVSGLWDAKTVQCTFGQYWAGDYRLWRRWRNSVAKPI